MTDNARRRHDADVCEPTPFRGDPFSIEAYLERQWAEFANGPTMAEFLRRADARRAGGVPREIIAAAIREERA